MSELSEVAPETNWRTRQVSQPPESALPHLSVVIPVMDEAPTIEELAERILDECEALNVTHEVIFVDDGSRDDSWLEITALIRAYSGQVRGLQLRGNVGKAHALSAGFQVSSGDILITMDGDLQDDPREIPMLLVKLAEGHDLIVGWKRDRKDPLTKVISSRIFNALANRFSGLALHDHNCGLKCFRRDVLADLSLYGDLHRMFPSLAAARGFSIDELVVRHHPRKHGRSKYGFGRALRSSFDLCTVLFLRRFHDRPAHLIGPLAGIMFAAGAVAFGLGLYKDILWGQGKVLLTVGPMAIIAALILFCTGLLSELVVHGHLSRRWTPPVRESVGFRDVELTPVLRDAEARAESPGERERCGSA